MTSIELIKQIAKKSAFSKKTIKSIFNEIENQIETKLKNNEAVKFPKIGKIAPITYASRTIKNIATKQKMNIPATIVAKFQASKALKTKINQLKTV